MAAVSGKLTGKARVQTTLGLSDVPNHELNLAEISGHQKSSNPEWDRAELTYWGTADLVGGTGPQRGYFVNVHANGDRDWGTFEGKIAPDAGQIMLEGKWSFLGGTGKLNGLSGGGTYKGRMLPPADIEIDWHGEYQIASAMAQGR